MDIMKTNYIWISKSLHQILLFLLLCMFYRDKLFKVQKFSQDPNTRKLVF